MKIEIKSRFNARVLFSVETESMKLALELAVQSGADLRGANLYDANLRGANLRGANLRGADLRGTDLRGADLYDANLRGADLRGADLRGADLRGTDLYYADLRVANLGGPGDEKLLLVGERPVLQLGPLGSRCAYMLAFLTDQGVYVRSECFWNTLEKFREAVEREHGDSNHGQEYRAAIALIELHSKLWTPAKEEEKAA